MPKPVYKYKIKFKDYDCDVIDGYNHYSGGPYLVLLEHDGTEWYEVDRWGMEGEEFIDEIGWIEDSVNGR